MSIRLISSCPRLITPDSNLAAALPKSQFDKVIVTTFGATDFDDILKIILNALKPNGKVVFLEVSAAEGANPTEVLKLNGFQNPTVTSQNGW